MPICFVSVCVFGFNVLLIMNEYYFCVKRASVKSKIQNTTPSPEDIPLTYLITEVQNT